MGTQGSPYSRFRRALAAGDLFRIRIAAAELPGVDLHDALAILPVIARQDPSRYDAAACRWLGRLALEHDTDLERLDLAVAALGELRTSPGAADDLAELLRP